jgi:hypothetical protein
MPQGTVIESGYTPNKSEGSRYHTWRLNEDNLGFDDWLIISDEEAPAPVQDGRSYTLWTNANNNQLVVNEQRHGSLTRV